MNNRPLQVAPSILSADFGKLSEEVKAVERAGADCIHCDVMDGHFVPNITFGPVVIESVKKSVAIPLDVHLMIENAERYVDAFCDAGADTLTVHADAVKNLPAVLSAIKGKGVKAGVCVNPDKEISLFEPYLEMIDQVLIMTVYAGFGGQKFIAEMLPKIAQVRDRIASKGLEITIEVDGGINEQTAADCASHGASLFVAGSFVFNADDYRQQIDAVRSGAARGIAR